MNMANISNKATVDVAVRESSLSREINISKSQNEQTFRDTLGGTDGNGTENLFSLHGTPVGQLSSVSSEAATTAGVISQDPIIEGARERDKDDRNLTVCPTGAILSQRAQELIDQINSKRKQDTQMMADFNKVLDMHVQKSCSSIEQMMFLTYEKEGKMIQDKLQELFATLDRIKKLEDELNQFKQALGILYQDVPAQAQE